MQPRTLVVGAAIIWREDGRLLIAQRRVGDPFVGNLWEFPGGKVEPDESIEACIAREITEEIGIRIRVGDLFARVEHSYAPNLTIVLYAHRCAYVSGDAQPLHCQAVRWVTLADLSRFIFAPADVPLVAKLRTALP